MTKKEDLKKDKLTFSELAMDRAEKAFAQIHPESTTMFTVIQDALELSARLHWITTEIRAIASVFVMKDTQLPLAKFMFEMANKLDDDRRSIDFVRPPKTGIIQ